MFGTNNQDRADNNIQLTPGIYKNAKITDVKLTNGYNDAPQLSITFTGSDYSHTQNVKEPKSDDNDKLIASAKRKSIFMKEMFIASGIEPTKLDFSAQSFEDWCEKWVSLFNTVKEELTPVDFKVVGSIYNNNSFVKIPDYGTAVVPHGAILKFSAKEIKENEAYESFMTPTDNAEIGFMSDNVEAAIFGEESKPLSIDELPFSEDAPSENPSF